MEKVLGNPDAAPQYHQFIQPVISVNGQEQHAPPLGIPDVFKAQSIPAQTVVQVFQEVQQLKDRSMQLKCPKCQMEIKTRVRYRRGRMTNVASGLLCVFGCFCGCCLIPCFMNNCKDVEHECPNCKYFIGNYRR